MAKLWLETDSGEVHTLEVLRFVSIVIDTTRNDTVSKKIWAIKLLRNTPGLNLGLKECKDLYEWVEKNKSWVDKLDYTLPC